MVEIPISSRQRQLLGVLNAKHGIAPGRELAEQLGVSPRTIRQTISELGDILDPEVVSIRSIASKGYTLEIRDRQRFHELISERGHFRTREDRIAYLLRVLLESDEWIALADLEEQMYVSRTTLENDLKEVRRQIVEKEPYIGLQRKHSSLLFEKDERKRREILIRRYIERWDFNSREGVAFHKSILDSEILEGIRKALREMLDRSGILLDDYGHIYLLLATAVLYERNLLGHSLDVFEGHVSPKTEELVKSYLDTLKYSWEVELTSADYRWFAAALDHLRYLGFGAAADFSGKSNEENEAQGIAEVLCRELQCHYGLDFSGDELFLKDLTQCAVSFILPQLSILPQNHFEYELLAKAYPYLVETAEHLSKRLAEMTHYEMREGEELYLLPIVASAAERQERRLKMRLRAVVVSHYSSFLTEYLCENLKKLFGNRISVMGAVPVYDRQKIEEYEPSLIITTVQAETFRNYNVPAVVTTAAVTQEDLLRIDAAIQKQEQLLVRRS